MESVHSKIMYMYTVAPHPPLHAVHPFENGRWGDEIYDIRIPYHTYLSDLCSAVDMRILIEIKHYYVTYMATH